MDQRRIARKSAMVARDPRVFAYGFCGPSSLRCRAQALRKPINSCTYRKRVTSVYGPGARFSKLFYTLDF